MVARVFALGSPASQFGRPCVGAEYLRLSFGLMSMPSLAAGPREPVVAFVRPGGAKSSVSPAGAILRSPRQRCFYLGVSRSKLR